jgi:hypothetical protein
MTTHTKTAPPPLKQRAAKQKKSTHTTGEALALSKNRTWQDFLDETAFIFFPEKNDWRLRLRYQLLEWAYRPTSYELMQFCIEYRIPRRTLYEWRDKYDDVRSTLGDIMLILGSRRRLAATLVDVSSDIASSKLHAHMIIRDLHRYDSEEEDNNRYQAALKKDEEDASQTINVIMSPAPVTGKVVSKTERQTIAKENHESHEMVEEE